MPPLPAATLAWVWYARSQEEYYCHDCCNASGQSTYDRQDSVSQVAFNSAD